MLFFVLTTSFFHSAYNTPILIIPQNHSKSQSRKLILFFNHFEKSFYRSHHIRFPHIHPLYHNPNSILRRIKLQLTLFHFGKDIGHVSGNFVVLTYSLWNILTNILLISIINITQDLVKSL